MQANAVSQRAVWCFAADAELPASGAVSMGGRRRNGGASILGDDGVLAASETLGSSFALQHHAQMQAIAVSQRAVWVLAPQPLVDSVSDAVPAHLRPEMVAHLFRGQVGCL